MLQKSYLVKYKLVGIRKIARKYIQFSRTVVNAYVIRINFIIDLEHSLGLALVTI